MNPIHMYFSIIYRQGKVMHDRVMKQFGVTGLQMEYIRYINQHPGAPQEELAKAMHIDKGAVAKSIKDLIEKDFVYRKLNPDDKRAYCLFPTQKAIEIHREGEVNLAKIKEQLTDGMTDEEFDTLVVLLGKLSNNMVKMMEEGKYENGIKIL